MPTGSLDDLTQLTRPALIVRWRAAYGEDPPKAFYAKRLAQGIAYREQVDADPELQRIERLVAKRLRQAARPRQVKRHPRLHPGARLLREWGHQTHEVTVTESGFVYRDKTYKSLSAIAREITGTRWSGPAFFGANA